MSLKEEILKFNRAMTPQEVAKILNIPVSLVLKRVREGKIPKIDAIAKPIRFDPGALAALVSEPISKPAKASGSLTSKKRIIGENLKGGFHKCI